MHLNTGWVDRGEESSGQMAASYHLQLLLLSPLCWQIIEAVAAFVHQLLSFAQPVLHWISAYFKVFHLDL